MPSTKAQGSSKVLIKQGTVDEFSGTIGVIFNVSKLGRDVSEFRFWWEQALLSPWQTIQPGTPNPWLDFAGHFAHNLGEYESRKHPFRLSNIAVENSYSGVHSIASTCCCGHASARVKLILGVRLCLVWRRMQDLTQKSRCHLVTVVALKHVSRALHDKKEKNMLVKTCFLLNMFSSHYHTASSAQNPLLLWVVCHNNQFYEKPAWDQHYYDKYLVLSTPILHLPGSDQGAQNFHVVNSNTSTPRLRSPLQSFFRCQQWTVAALNI